MHARLNGVGAPGVPMGIVMPAVGRADLERAVHRTTDYLLQRQAPEGYWAGELEADVSVSAGYGPLMYLLVGKADPDRQRKAADFVLSRQNPDGSWSNHPGGPGDLGVSIQAYLSLKLAGHPAKEPCMCRAREFILSRGGIGRSNVFTRIWLALFGQMDWRWVPSVPPELILLPNWFYFNIYEFASWSRATIMALSVVLTLKPVCRLPDWAGVEELYLEPEGKRRYPLSEMGKREGVFSWRSFFLLADSLFKLWDRAPIKPGRATALRRTERWIVEHQEQDGSWAGIMLPWVYSLAALKALGYPMDHPVMVRGLDGLDGFIAEDETTLRLQPATSPVWDTAWSVLALREAGLPANHPALKDAARWLLKKRIARGGDWQVKNPRTEPGCWSFEFWNDQFPDMDDTAVVGRALRRVQLDVFEETAKNQAIDGAAEWVASMQSRDGGWAAFDLNNDKQFLSHVPFADFMSPLDPTCADVTAHAVELLAEWGDWKLALKRAQDYLLAAQKADGAWYGRWGVNYVYGTAMVLEALGALGGEARRPQVERAVSWLISRQNADGGWGESCQSYADGTCRGKGQSTASQTAWAVLGLIGVGEAGSRAVSRGIDYLVRTQLADGSWGEELYTGTGFPRAFYLRYDLYRVYFPLMALARYRGLLEGAE
ncbi:MAG TPA: squalene--hopene cyclase [Chloroflexota bacterium]|nr:squalene--hopene cyclase [Chloroflexota bacterium]